MNRVVLHVGELELRLPASLAQEPRPHLVLEPLRAGLHVAHQLHVMARVDLDRTVRRRKVKLVEEERSRQREARERRGPRKSLLAASASAVARLTRRSGELARPGAKLLG